MASSTWGWEDRSQKNHVNADDVVSLPAKMKLMIISLRNSSEQQSSRSTPMATVGISCPCPMLLFVLLSAMNRERRSVCSLFVESSAVPPPFLISLLRRLITSMANPCTTATASESRFSDPMLSSLFIFHTNWTGADDLPALSIAATSSAPASSDSPKRASSDAGSTPKATLQIVSNANRCRMSCKSKQRPVSLALCSTGRSRSVTSSTTLTTKLRPNSLMGFICTVDVLQPGRGNPNGREWISGVEFDSKGVYLALVTNIGCLSVHDYETLYCKSTSNQIKHGRREKDFRNDTKPILHISTHEKLDAVRWNPTNQDEVGCVSERSSKILLFDIACISVEPSEVLKRKPKSSLQQNMEHIGLSDMAFSRNDKFRILACGLDGNLHLWDRRASKSSCSVMSVPSPLSPLSSLELTSDEQVAIVGSKYGNVYAWDLRGGRTSAAFLSHKEVYHPPLATINIGSLLGKISSLKAQTEIGSSGIQSINIDPSCQHQLAFHLSNGWSGILNLNSLKVTHIHCPPPPWIREDIPTTYVYHKRKPAWLHTDSIYAVGSSLGNGINFLDFSPDMKSSCYVTYDSDDLQTDSEERVGHSLNHFLQASSSVVSCATHPHNTSIIGGTEGGFLVLIAQNNESVSGEDSISDEQVKSGVHSDMS